MQFKFTVRGDRITRENDNSFVEGNQNSYTAVFDFGNDANWDNVAKLCVVETDSGNVYRLPIIDGNCKLPVFRKGKFEIGVMGALTYDGDVIEGEEGIVISTNMYPCETIRGAATKEANAELNTAAEVWMKYISDMEEKRVSCEESANEARISAKSAKESATSVQKIAEMTVSAESLPEGEPATVTKTEDENTIHLKFGIPKGEKGPKGDKGDDGAKGDKGNDGKDGKTPVKGVDYFTPADIEEFNNVPKERVNFANNPLGEMKFVSDRDGLKLVWDWVEGKAEFLIASWESDMVSVNYANSAGSAASDNLGNDILTTYATKVEVDTKIQTYIEEAILGGAW